MVFDGALGTPSDTQAVSVSIAPVEDASIAGRHVFYNNSSLDGGLVGAGVEDDGAIAADKSALLPGQTGGASNRTIYAKGLNGIMVDIADFAGAGGLNVATVGDYFGFKAGSGGDPSSWDAAAAVQVVDVRAGEGEGGSDRVTVIWADNDIRGQWLQVTVKAGAATGLAADDVFYFGNIAGDGNGDGIVDAADYINLKLTFGDSVGVHGSQSDFDCTGTIDLGDLVALAGDIGQNIEMPFLAPELPEGAASVPEMSGAAQDDNATPPIAVKAIDGGLESSGLDSVLSGLVEVTTLIGDNEGDVDPNAEAMTPTVTTYALQAAPAVFNILASVQPPRQATGPRSAPSAQAAPAALAATPVGSAPVYVSRRAVGPAAGQTCADVFALAKPYWADERARPEPVDAPWMTRSLADIVGKPRKGRHGLDYLDVCDLI